MADVLDQDEIDALLNAVADGEIGGDNADAAGALGEDSGKDTREIHTYDFKRPERVSKDHMLAFEGLHERFSRNFGAGLSAYLRTIIEVKVRSTEQLTYAEFTYSLPVPTCFFLLSCEPLEGEICLELSPLIVYPIIDRMLGGGNADLYVPQRPLTQIEQRLTNRIIERALISLEEAWSNISNVKFKVIQQESNPQLVQIVAPNEPVVVIGFEIKMGDRCGSMSLCIPFNVVEPIMQDVASQDWFSQKKRVSDAEDRRPSLMENLAEAKVKARTYIAQTQIRLSELLRLQVGDVITTKKQANSELTMHIEGKSKFAGKAGQFRGHRAFKVTRQATPGEKI